MFSQMLSHLFRNMNGTTSRRPLSAFESYMLLDDSEEHPMTFFLRLQFRGTIEHERLVKALRTVVRRHPLLRATVCAAGRSRHHWMVEDGDSLITVGRHVFGRPFAHRLPPFRDLFQEPGVYASLATDRGASELWLQFHHACCDGMAAVQLVDELLAAYQDQNVSASNGGEWQPEGARDSVDGAASIIRADHAHGRRSPKLLRLQRSGLRRHCQRLWKFVRRRPYSIGSQLREPTGDEWYPAWNAFLMSDQHRLLRTASESTIEAKASVNDHLLAAVFGALGDWLRRRGEGDARSLLRVAVPISLRHRDTSAIEHQAAAACENCVSMVFLDRTLDDTLSSASLLRGISDELSQIKRTSLAGTTLQVLALLRAVPGAMRQFLRFAGSTTVVSNLGVILPSENGQPAARMIEADGLTLESIQFLPPVRRDVPISFGVLTYAGALSVTLHYDPRVLEHAEATDLLDRVQLQLDRERSEYEPPVRLMR